MFGSILIAVSSQLVYDVKELFLRWGRNIAKELDGMDVDCQFSLQGNLMF